MKKNNVINFFDKIEREDEQLKKWAKWIKQEEEIINELVKQRNKKGISQTELSDLIGLKQPAIARLENGINSPQLNTIIKYLDSLNLKFRIVAKDLNKDDTNNKYIIHHIGSVKSNHTNDNTFKYEYRNEDKNEYSTIKYPC